MCSCHEQPPAHANQPVCLENKDIARIQKPLLLILQDKPFFFVLFCFLYLPIPSSNQSGNFIGMSEEMNVYGMNLQGAWQILALSSVNLCLTGALRTETLGRSHLDSNHWSMSQKG